MSEANVEFRPVKVRIEGQSDARLAFLDDELIAVLIKLDSTHGDLEGKWYVEAAFNHLEGMREQTFDSLDDVCEWVSSQPDA